MPLEIKKKVAGINSLWPPRSIRIGKVHYLTRPKWSDDLQTEAHQLHWLSWSEGTMVSLATETHTTICIRTEQHQASRCKQAWKRLEQNMTDLSWWFVVLKILSMSDCPVVQIYQKHHNTTSNLNLSVTLEVKTFLEKDHVLCSFNAISQHITVFASR